MYKTTRLKKTLNIQYESEIKEFLNPETIQLKGYLVNDLQESSQVFKDSVITTNPISFSPISGKIIQNQSNIITIQNDYMENYESPRKPSERAEYTIDIVQKLLKAYNFSNDQVLKELGTHPNTILINAIDDIPYLQTRSQLLQTKINPILEACEILYNTVQPNNIIFAIKNTDTQNIELYHNHVGSFPFISYRYLNDEYPLSFKEILTKKLSLNYYNTIVITIEELLEIYEIVKRLRPNSECYLSIVIENGKSFVLKTKIGTNLQDIINKYDLPLQNKIYYHQNILNNHSIDPLDYIINIHTKAIYIMQPHTLKTYPCINCGLCYSECPFEINPLNPQEMVNCRHCGLCTYHCPANIQIEGDKNA